MNLAPNSQNREQEAIEAYLKFLQAKGVNSISLAQRQSFLFSLAPEIAETYGNDLLYRKKLETVIETKDSATWPFCLSVAREFYLFWTQDIKAIAALVADDGFDLDIEEWQPPDCDLQTLWSRLEKFAFSTAEMWPLKAYTQVLRQHRINSSHIDTRVKLAKLLVMRLRDLPEHNLKTYRNMVGKLLPLFGMKETRHLFLAIAHEYYYFWNGDPNAASYVLSRNSETSKTHL